jgi:NAD(P)H-dependent FMN reductase
MASAENIRILALAGSTREDSLNKKLALNAAEMARQMGASVTFIDIRDYPMPFYDGDLEATMGMPSNAKQLRQHFVDAQVILIASPEYNASVSAVLKNAIDWTSRSPNGGGSREAFKDKKIAIMSVSPGNNGGARGLPHLRTIMEDVGGIVLPQQVSVPNGNSAFDAQGNLTNPQAKSELQQLIKKALN